MIEPKLRFPEFNSNWTHDNLENVAEIFDGTHQTPLYTKIGVQFVSVENIEDIYKSEKHISHEEYDKYKSKPQINDILMTRITAGVIGETAMVTKDVPLAYYVSLALIRCEKLLPSYVEKYIHSIQFRKELYKRIIHTAFPKKINLGDIGKCLVGITNEQEQQKIAEFLSTIDTVIEKQKETVSAWEERKKGVMQKLFSQEVRFKADDGSDFPEWEEKKLGDVADLKVGEKPTLVSDNATYEYVNAGTTNSGYVDSYNCDGDTVTTPSRGQGGIGYVGYQKHEFWLGPLCYKIKSNKDDVLTKFMYYALSFDSKKIVDLKKVGTIPAINRADLIELYMSFPYLVEQQKIVDCLSSLDEVIKKLKAALAAWEEMKKGLLQQMFI